MKPRVFLSMILFVLAVPLAMTGCGEAKATAAKHQYAVSMTGVV